MLIAEATFPQNEGNSELAVYSKLKSDVFPSVSEHKLDLLIFRYESIDRRKVSSSSHNEVFVTGPPVKKTVQQVRKQVIRNRTGG